MRLEAPPSMFPIIIVQSRYGGTYEGGEWFALSNAEEPTETLLEALGEDAECAGWFADNAHRIGVGDNPNDAYINLLQKEVGDAR